MALRVLVIDGEPAYRRLLAQHVSTGFEDPVVVEYDPIEQGHLPQGFVGSAYDAVLLGDSTGADKGLDWLRDLAQREGFPPVVFMSREATPRMVDAALAAGARACLPLRKVDHAGLVAALRDAQNRRKAPPQESYPEPPAPREARFGDVTLRGYQQVKQLAETPASSVYLAESERDGQQVVLKVLRQAPEGSQGSKVFDRFLREYEIASKIVHPHVVRVFDFGAGDDCAYIAMEYFPLGDLRGRIKAGIKPLQALTYLRQMAEALKVLHGAGVLHRDLKPGNVMLRDERSVVLIDYGMSKQLELDAAITSSGEIFGTPYYMSPEQGHGRETDERSDLYSLGVIFYEMLMRRKPYVAGTPMQVIYKHANSPLPELPPELKRFEGMLYNCIAKDPRRRYASADRLVDVAREAERDEAERQAPRR